MAAWVVCVCYDRAPPAATDYPLLVEDIGYFMRVKLVPKPEVLVVPLLVVAVGPQDGVLTSFTLCVWLLQFKDLEPIVSVPVGPVEAGPPKVVGCRCFSWCAAACVLIALCGIGHKQARELKVLGERRVGSLLVCHTTYFGGVQGASE